MKLFGPHKKSKKTKLEITDLDRRWVEDNFNWLISVYGYPSSNLEQITITARYFPKSFSTDKPRVQDLINDLCVLLSLESSKISYELHEDLRDVYGMPYEIEGEPFNTETEIVNEKYKIHIANSITKRPSRLTYSLIYEFIKIRLTESELKYDTGNDTGLFIFLAGIYFGFGVPLSQNLTDKGRIIEGFWETKWNYVSEMPHVVMAFALATYSKLTDKDNPEWKKELPPEIRDLFDQSIIQLNESPSTIFNRRELTANDILYQANQEYQKGNYESAISIAQKSLFLTEDNILKADIYNMIGYCYLRSGDYEKSIPHLHKAINHDSNFGFAYDNLGFALIQTGKLEEGKELLEIASKTKNNDLAYNFRNLALYYVAKNETQKAESNFQLAFESITDSVDLLEFYYGLFLSENGEQKKGNEYLAKAVKKSEQEAINYMNEINKNNP